MKERILLISGCSHTCGSEIDGTEDSRYNRENAFGALLAKKLNRRPVNISQHGNTNAAIMRSVMLWFKNYFDAETMDVQVLVAWSESSRIEVPRKGDLKGDNSLVSIFSDWIDKSPDYFHRVNSHYFGHADGSEKEYFEQFHRFMEANEVFLEILSAQFVLLLQNYFKANNIKYLMCNTMHMFTLPEIHLQMYIDLIDTTNYYNMTDNNKAFFWYYRNRGYINLKAKYWHHDEIPHKMYADELYEFIGANKCLS